MPCWGWLSRFYRSAAACAADGLPCSIWAVARHPSFQTEDGCAAAFFVAQSDYLSLVVGIFPVVLAMGWPIGTSGGTTYWNWH